MLQAYPTKNGTGVAIFGDYGDLKSLHTMVHHIAQTIKEGNKWQEGQQHLLMGFAYDIRKAYEGKRLNHVITFIGDDKPLNHYGFQVVWTDILIFISTLRHHAGFIYTEKIHQSSMYLLEYVIENALYMYDSTSAAEIQSALKDIPVTLEYFYIIFQGIHMIFVSDRGGKVRFRKIPQMFSNYFNTWSDEYKSLIANFQRTATEKKGEITDFYYDFPQIKRW